MVMPSSFKSQNIHHRLTEEDSDGDDFLNTSCDVNKRRFTFFVPRRRTTETTSQNKKPQKFLQSLKVTTWKVKKKAREPRNDASDESEGTPFTSESSTASFDLSDEKETHSPIFPICNISVETIQTPIIKEKHEEATIGAIEESEGSADQSHEKETYFPSFPKFNIFTEATQKFIIEEKQKEAATESQSNKENVSDVMRKHLSSLKVVAGQKALDWFKPSIDGLLKPLSRCTPTAPMEEKQEEEEEEVCFEDQYSNNRVHVMAFDKEMDVITGVEVSPEGVMNEHRMTPPLSESTKLDESNEIIYAERIVEEKECPKNLRFLSQDSLEKMRASVCEATASAQVLFKRINCMSVPFEVDDPAGNAKKSLMETHCHAVGNYDTIAEEKKEMDDLGSVFSFLSLESQQTYSFSMDERNCRDDTNSIIKKTKKGIFKEGKKFWTKADSRIQRFVKDFDWTSYSQEALDCSTVSLANRSDVFEGPCTIGSFDSDDSSYFSSYVEQAAVFKPSRSRDDSFSTLTYGKSA